MKAGSALFYLGSTFTPLFFGSSFVSLCLLIVAFGQWGGAGITCELLVRLWPAYIVYGFYIVINSELMPNLGGIQELVSV